MGQELFEIRGTHKKGKLSTLADKYRKTLDNVEDYANFEPRLGDPFTPVKLYLPDRGVVPYLPGKEIPEEGGESEG